MNLYNIPKHKDSPSIVNAIIEIPKGTNVKYEYSQELDIFFADRTLCSAMAYPASYGFIPKTLTDDGDPLDIMVYNSSPFNMGTLVEAKVIGVLDMNDGDQKDWKILATPVSHKKRYRYLRDIDPVFLDVCKNFFAHYKDIDSKKGTTVFDWHSAARAKQIISESQI